MIDTESWQQHNFVNHMQTFLLLFSMMAFLGLLGWALWGIEGIVVLLLSGIFILALSPNISPSLIMRLYRARPLSLQQLPQLYRALAELAERSGLTRTPRIYYIPSRMINAFAVGQRNEAVIAITDGFLRNFSTREAIAVFAHEVSHIRSNDMRVMGTGMLESN